ncbi:MAG: Iron-containing alcohol dehydrogenase [Candidatus Poribacteria bacterium]|nr:Iron-containing alcohol dehydrogenase [Candidatus Poribacteria bacterium]
MSLEFESLSTQIFGATIEFGIGVIRNLPEYINRLNVSRSLLVSDKGLVNSGAIDSVFDILKISDIEYVLFDGVQPNPVDTNVMDGLDIYKKNNCNAIIGIGGGSPIDVSKAIRVIATRSGHIRDYFLPTVVKGDKPILIAIPTMSGTGSEVATGSIITDTEINRKRVIRHTPPSLAVVDPELTVKVPPYLTAATGIDALSHNIEACVAINYNPLAEAIAIAGIKLISKNLRRAVEDGTNLESRKNMSMASMMGALAFRKGLGASHSLSHQLSTEANVHHGVANAIMLPYVMEFNLEFVPEKYADIAQAMGVDTSGMSVIQSAKASIQAVRELCKDIGLPERLSAVGVNLNMITIMSKQAMEDHCHLLNPRLCTKEDMYKLYKSAL